MTDRASHYTKSTECGAEKPQDQKSPDWPRDQLYGAASRSNEPQARQPSVVPSELDQRNPHFLVLRTDTIYRSEPQPESRELPVSPQRSALSEWLKANYQYPPQEGVNFNTLNALIKANPNIDSQLPEGLRREFTRLLIENAESRFNIKFRGQTPFNAALKSDGQNPSVIVQEREIDGWHAQYVGANAALACKESGNRGRVALMSGDLSMNEDYFRIIYANVDVVHTSGDKQVTYRASDLNPDAHTHIRQSRTFYTRTTGNAGRRAVLSDDPNNMPQTEQAGNNFLYGHGALIGAATVKDGQVQLSESSSLNIPTVIVLEPDPTTKVHRPDYLGRDNDEDGYNSKPIRGTSFTASRAAGWIGTIKDQNPSLDNELIKYCMISSAQPVFMRENREEAVQYVTNAAGNRFNIGAGAGLLTWENFSARVERLNDILAQKDTTNVPYSASYDGQKVGVGTPHPKGEKYQSEGVYEINVPEDFTAVTLKITGEFKDGKSGPLMLISPSGTEFPLDVSDRNSDGSYFFASIGEAWAGEHTKGKWRICTPGGIEITNLKLTIEGNKGNVIDRLNQATKRTELKPENNLNYGDRPVLTHVSQEKIYITHLGDNPTEKMEAREAQLFQDLSGILFAFRTNRGLETVPDNLAKDLESIQRILQKDGVAWNSDNDREELQTRLQHLATQIPIGRFRAAINGLLNRYSN